jgi:hypothetical protein
VTGGGEPAPAWSLQTGIDPELWPEEARNATAGLHQGTLVASPPLTYAASADYPIHSTTRRWASSPRANTGVVNVASTEGRAPWGLIVTQTCDLVEEGKPKRPWVHISPVYELYAPAGDRTRILQARGFDYLMPVTALEAVAGALWVADLRLLVPVEKGWLVGRETRAAFTEQAEYQRLAQQLAHRFARPAFATIVVDRIQRPAHKLFADIIERYEGNDPIADVGLALGRSPLEPVNAQLVFLLDGELGPELRAHIVDWWHQVAEHARADGLEILAPRFVSLDELSAREYRSLYLLDASSLSPEPEDPPDSQ